MACEQPAARWTLRADVIASIREVSANPSMKSSANTRSGSASPSPRPVPAPADPVPRKAATSALAEAASASATSTAARRSIPKSSRESLALYVRKTAYVHNFATAKPLTSSAGAHTRQETGHGRQFTGRFGYVSLAPVPYTGW